jgi:hypothetical protein
MAWTDGGPMLWPVPFDDGAGGIEPGWRPALTRYGFVDAAARVVVQPRYTAYDYCITQGHPSRVVAVDGYAVDVLALDGTVTKTIKTPRDAGSEAPRPGERAIVCLDSRIVLYTFGEGVVGWQESYDVASGKPATSADPLRAEDLVPDSVDDPDPGPAQLPEGYLAYVGGGWVSDQGPDSSEAEPATFLNIDTQAVVEPGDVLGQAGCWGTAGFLVCSNAVLSFVYDSRGAPTRFREVTSDGVLTVPPGAPYLWAVAGDTQGYIDLDGTWHYRESIYTSLKD